MSVLNWLFSSRSEQEELEESKAYLERFHLLDRLAEVEESHRDTYQNLLGAINSLARRNVKLWYVLHGRRFGPMNPSESNISCMVQTSREVAAIILPRKGQDDVLEWNIRSGALVVELYTQYRSLQERFVVVKNSRGSYNAYLAWLA